VTEIQAANVRVRTAQGTAHNIAIFEWLKPDGIWETVLGTGLSPDVSEEPTLEWNVDGGDMFAASAFLESATITIGNEIVLCGTAACHRVEETISIKGANHVHVNIRDDIASGAGSVSLGRLMSHLYFIPGNRADRTAEPLDFAWLPALHNASNHVCSDHFFRSPAVIVQSNGFFAALVPDLTLFAANRTIPHALDLRVTETKIDAPRLSYGIMPSHCDGHVYYAHHDNETQIVDGDQICYGFDLFYGQADEQCNMADRISTFLWETYGKPAFADIRPQVLPFEEYGRRYSYVHELPRTLHRAVINGVQCAGIDNPHRRGANFHAWENDLHPSYGIRHYAGKWADDDLGSAAEGILGMIRQAPRSHGAFPCVYNFERGEFEGTLWWVARCVDSFGGYDTAAMGVTAWWQLLIAQDFGLERQCLGDVLSYAAFLASAQLPSGAIPTYFSADLQPFKQLKESATTAISGAVLAAMALETGDPNLADAAIRAGKFIESDVLPSLAFYDFETFYSCSPKPLHWIDRFTGIKPQNTLCLQWACDQFLALYKLTHDDHWLRTGQYMLSILSLYQQVWNPTHYAEYLYGGFGVMNTDGEWSDGRQARFVSTYADYYLETNNIEYLERAVAACRASFALMDIEENHAGGINDIVMEQGPGLGYAPENLHHCGADARESSGWTGFNWSSGGALSASAYLERRFGGVWVDGLARTITPIDGVSAFIREWSDGSIKFDISSALLGQPKRTILVRFGRMPLDSYDVVVNGHAHPNLTRDDLAKGLAIEI